MDGKERYITRPPEGQEPYTELQRRTLAELQRLSGEVWTDYNPGDPGVTVADVANYALTETGYRQEFPLEDYLAGKDGSWAQEMYGLFPARSVYPSAPVTAEDYRRAILTRFPMVENVTVIPRRETGQYDVRLRISPYFSHDGSVEASVLRFLNRHRNLCEQFGRIETESPEELFFHADFEIETGCDTTGILVEMYDMAVRYLAGDVEIVRPASDDALPMREDEWYEGPVKDVRADIPAQRNTEYELYMRLTWIPGIVSFKTCYFKDKDGHIVTDFTEGYTLNLSKDLKHMKVRIGRESVYADGDEFVERLKAKFFMRGTFRTRHLMQEREGRDTAGNGRNTLVRKEKATLYRSEYRNIYDHAPLAGDLPSCYATSDKDLLRDTPAEEKAATRNFGNYLRLFDLLMQRGLNELDGLKRLLALDMSGKELSRMETLPDGVLDMNKVNDRYRNTVALRTRYMDFIDGLYGTDSAPEWMTEFDCYGQTEDDRLRRRMRFLKALPDMIRDRSRSFDITGTYGGENVPVVKRYLSLLLDFDTDEETTVGNVLPGHNLILMGDGEHRERLRGLMSSQMIDDDVFDPGAVEAVAEDIPPATKDEKLKRYEDLRRHLPIFNSNWINGSLFREGIMLGNYNLVDAGNGEWLLVFRGKEETRRMNLGRSDDRGRLAGWANTLCRYLRELNRLCEAVYVVEKSLFDPVEPFTVMLVFTGWTARTRSPRFREACTQLVRSVIPSHLKMEIHWIGALQMQYFEDGYKKWRESMSGNAPADIRAAYLKKMTDALSTDFMQRHKGEEKDKENGMAHKEDSV
ncbi:hypothetical protein [Bacteroides fragilis]|uniref:hypothetical protein n=1 Tax=Bacteroides fragilis TaxID=817 RepID=UPI002458C3AA|nr:hypothetical protein [Bacteroides fragilis]